MKAVVALIDTPFLYAARGLAQRGIVRDPFGGDGGRDLERRNGDGSQ
jgi:hypothetical protein